MKSKKLHFIYPFLALVIAGCGKTPNPSEAESPTNSEEPTGETQTDSLSITDESESESPDISIVSESEQASDTVEESDSGDEEDEVTSIADAKKSSGSEPVTVQGQVTRILYNSGRTTTPYIFINDDSGCIVLYNKAFTNVAEGDLIQVTGLYSVYNGTPELTDFTVDKIISQGNEIPTSWIQESTVTDLLDIEVNVDNVGQIYKVPCIPVQGNYNAYSIKELSGENIILTYSQSSYSEYDFLKPYLDKPVEIYVQLGVPRTSAGNLSWRVQPISVIGEYTSDDMDLIKGILDEPFKNYSSFYYEEGYDVFPIASSQLEGATFAYSVDNEEIATIKDLEGKVEIDYDGLGTVNVTCTISYSTTEVQETREVQIQDKPATIESISIADLKADKVDGDEVVLAGYVAGMVYDNGTDGNRRNAFYLLEDTGSVYVDLSVDMVKEVQLKPTEYVIIKGEYDIYPAACNSVKILNSEVLYRSGLEQESTLFDNFPTKTFAEMYDFKVDNTNNRSGDLFMMHCIIKKFDTQYGGIQYYVFDFETTDFDNANSKNIYQAPAADLSYLDPYLDEQHWVLMGIHDRKPETGATELANGGYYRYDILDILDK